MNGFWHLTLDSDDPFLNHPCIASTSGIRTSVPEPAAKDADEGSFELPTGASIDDGVHHGVTVAQPEDDLKQPARDVTGGAQGLWKYIKHRRL